MIPRRYQLEKCKGLLHDNPLLVLLGPRQCGKTTLARNLGPSAFFDLENPADRQRLENPGLAFENGGPLIALDEVQNLPSIFPFLRHWVDHHPQQKFLLLGSASLDLINQSAESLAGRAAFWELSGFNLGELGVSKWRELWRRGAFPRSYLASSDASSLQWRNDFIRTYLERDIPQFGIRIPSAELRRFWTMIAHLHGQVLNYRELSRSFGLSDVTVRRYLEILESTLTVRTLKPWHENAGKRVVKRPKVYLRDSGLHMALLNISDIESHPAVGASWEGFVIEQRMQELKFQHPGAGDEHFFFWSTHSEAEVDLFFEWNGKRTGFEAKLSESPKVTRSMRSAIENLSLDRLEILCPSPTSYFLEDKVFVRGLDQMWSAKQLN